MTTASVIPAARDLVEQYSAHNYDPLPVVVAEAEGAWVTDVDGRRYLDLLSAYSALNFGHRHPRLVAAAKAQLDRVTLTSRAFHNDQLGHFCAALATLAGTDLVLPMNTGAEAVETAIKASRAWGYRVKGVGPDQARIVVCAGNFHGRTTTIVGFSTNDSARRDFGPFTPGFDVVPFGDAEALEEQIAAAPEDTVAFLVEPVQGEAGVVVPPPGYLRAAREICDRYDVLLVADEVQSGLGRTGATFACDHEGVRPDLYVLGKALAGGIVPLSAVTGSTEVLGVFRPGQHGSTFGGNPLACAIGREVIAMLVTGEPQQQARRLGERLLAGLHDGLDGSGATVHGLGLWAGVDVPGGSGARECCEALLRAGVLTSDTRGRTVRIAPPFVITEDELDWALDRLVPVLG
jgi:ornithine--oxo-acid transaminase